MSATRVSHAWFSENISFIWARDGYGEDGEPVVEPDIKVCNGRWVTQHGLRPWYFISLCFASYMRPQLLSPT